MRGVVLLGFALLTACSTVDLRPDSAPTEVDRREGRQLLRALADTHGGRAAWANQEVVQVRMRDDWRGFYHLVAGPWPKNATLFELTLLPAADDGRIEFLEVDKPGWGIQNWKTYKVRDDEIEFTDSGKLAFWIPTTIYFVEAPFRLVEATTVYEMPSREVGGRTYRRVFATWGSDAPQKDVDQYVVWIDADSGELAWLQYTIRDYGKWMEGLMAYSDYRDFGGFRLATTMRVVDEPGVTKKGLHEYRVESVDLSPDVDRAYVAPRPDLRGDKY